MTREEVEENIIRAEMCSEVTMPGGKWREVLQLALSAFTPKAVPMTEKPLPPETWLCIPQWTSNHPGVHATKLCPACVQFVPATAVAQARAEVYEKELVRLREWIEAYHVDLFKERRAPFTSPDSAAAAMGRHILGLLIMDFEAAQALAQKEKE